jgi:hypothetical protein
MEMRKFLRSRTSPQVVKNQIKNASRRLVPIQSNFDAMGFLASVKNRAALFASEHAPFRSIAQAKKIFGICRQTRCGHTIGTYRLAKGQRRARVPPPKWEIPAEMLFLSQLSASSRTNKMPPSWFSLVPNRCNVRSDYLSTGTAAEKNWLPSFEKAYELQGKLGKLSWAEFRAGFNRICRQLESKTQRVTLQKFGIEGIESRNHS